MLRVKTLNDLRIACEQINKLKKISRQLNNAFTADCNYGNTPRRDKREEKLEKQAKDIATEMGLFIYVQGDPRGASLYLLENKYEATQSLYNRGMVIY